MSKTTKVSPEEIAINLSHFTETQNYYFQFLKQFVYTDGVKYLADSTGSHWLITAIASHQPQLKKEPMLAEFQIWNLKVNSDRSAVLRCYRDLNDLALQKMVRFTNFPLPDIKLYLENGVLMLPNER
jgi:hypothetical protein